MINFKWFTSWAARIRRARYTLYVSIDKGVARALGLKAGDTLYAYRGEDEVERPVMLVYLDKKEMYEEKKNGNKD